MVPGVAGLLVARHVEEDKKQDLAIIHQQQMEEKIVEEILPKIAILTDAVSICFGPAELETYRILLVALLLN